MIIRFIWLALLVSIQPPAEPTVDELERAALSARQRLISGHLTFRSKWVEPKSKKLPVLENKYKIWFDSNRIRIDKIRRVPGKKPYRILECVNCVKNGYFLSYIQKDPVKNLPWILAIGKTVKQRKDKNDMTDPRLLGLVPTTVSALKYFHFGMIIGRPDRKNTTLKKTKWKGKTAYLIEFELKDKTSRHKYWIVPELQHSVVRMESEYRHPKGMEKLLMKTVPKKFGKFWFPGTCEYTQVYKNKLRESEKIIVERAEFNRKIPNKYFNLIGMEIPIGTPIWNADTNTTGIWTGSKVGPDTRSHDKRLKTAAGSVNYWLIGAAISLSVGASICVWLFLRAKNQTSLRHGH